MEEIKKTGTKSRPLKGDDSMANSEQGESGKGKKGKAIKVNYPHKKHTTRDAFFENWPENFSK